MTRQQLEHIIRAAAATADVRDIIVIGSQSILGAFPTATGILADSMEADVFPKDSPERSIVIDGAIGEESLFHKTFGYYAHGVDETTAVLPDGWRGRLIQIRPAISDAVGWCLEPNDLAASKLAAGREKDLLFVAALAELQLIDIAVLHLRLTDSPRLSPEQRLLAQARLKRVFRG